MEKYRKHISVLVPTYNEVGNVVPLCAALEKEFTTSLSRFDYDILFIDNASTDGTRERLEELCAKNPHVRAIFNTQNFGQFNSPYYGICQTTGDCTVSMCADFQDPVEMLPRLVEKWEEGYLVVCAVKTASRENAVLRFLRTCYYKLIKKASRVAQIEHFTGFGLYDKSFVEVMRALDDPTPFLRGIVAELAPRRVEIPYTQARRRAGRTHNNFATLYDAAWQSFTTYTKLPIRAITVLGFLLLALGVAWGATLCFRGTRDAPLGVVLLSPLMLLCTAFVLLSLGALGEYVLTLREKVMRRPLVVEERRIGFDRED